jgi:transposase-like protein
MKHRHDEVEYRHQVDLPGRGRREHELCLYLKYQIQRMLTTSVRCPRCKHKMTEAGGPISQLTRASKISCKTKYHVQNESRWRRR